MSLETLNLCRFKAEIIRYDFKARLGEVHFEVSGPGAFLIFGTAATPRQEELSGFGPRFRMLLYCRRIHLAYCGYYSKAAEA